jgi:hypothetical protein
MDRRGRWAAALAAVLLTLAIVLSYTGRAVLRAQPFADRAVAVLRDPAVQADVADHLTAAIIRAGKGELDSVRPLIRPIAGTVVASGPFSALFRRGVLEAHRVLMGEGGGPVLVTVADAGVLIEGVLTQVAPQAARRLDSERVVTVLSLRPGGLVRDLVRIMHALYVLAWAFAALALVIAAGLLWRASDRRAMARRLGVGVLASGGVIAAAYLVGGAIVGQVAPIGRGAAARAVWRGFLHGLYVEALLIAAAGAAAAALSARGLRRSDAVSVLADVRAALAGDLDGGSGRRRALIAIGLVLVGLAILLEPAPTLTLAALGIGLYVFARGAQGLVSIVGRAPSALRRVPAGAISPARRWVGPTLALALTGAALAVALTGAADEAPAVAAPRCEDSAALCDRTLNDVSLAATHNSMASVTIPTWLFGQQDGTIREQLAFGIRGLLIDSYYGEAVGGRVRTDLESLPKRETAVEELGAPAVDAALRIRGRLAREGAGKREIFLCHGFCEIGAITLASALRDLRSFLVSHPDAVVEVINQDEGVTPADTERAFEQAGLLDLVYRGPLGPFPTLREMIDSGQRLVVMAENDAGTIPWYHLAYEHALQETPFRFTRASQLTDPANLPASCRAHRGPDSAPLFLLNHWIDTTPVPRASLAEVVNAREPLLTRAEECQRIRHRLPNLVAVDFFRRGDVLGVVNTLNGISSPGR